MILHLNLWNIHCSLKHIQLQICLELQNQYLKCTIQIHVKMLFTNKQIVYLYTTTLFICSYMVKNPLLPLHGLFFPISSKGSFTSTIPPHRQDNIYHSLCFTSCGVLARTRNSSMGPPWWIDPITHHTMSVCSTMELYITPKILVRDEFLWNILSNEWHTQYIFNS